MSHATVCDYRTGRTIEANAEVTEELLELCSHQANRDRGVLALRDPDGCWRAVDPSECEPGEPHPTAVMVTLEEQ